MANEGRVFYNNIIKESVITSTGGGGIDSGYPLNRIYNQMPSVTTRSNGIGVLYINFDFGVATNIQGIVLLGHNMESGDSLLFQSSDNNWTSLLDSVAMTKKTRSVKINNSNGTLVDVVRRDAYAQAAWNQRWYRIRTERISGTYVEAGEVYIMAGNYLFDLNYIWRYTAGREHVHNRIVTPYGQEHITRKYSREVGELTFQQIGDTQKELFDEEIGENEKVVFINGISGHLYYGHFAFPPPTHVFIDNWTQSATFNETL